jgi:hypothetical protein
MQNATVFFWACESSTDISHLISVSTVDELGRSASNTFITATRDFISDAAAPKANYLETISSAAARAIDFLEPDRGMLKLLGLCANCLVRSNRFHRDHD